jgi:hypothetical protein
MGKRSNFERRPRDQYDTPAAAVLPLKPHLPKRFRYVEPCAFRGTLIDLLRDIGGTCVASYDIDPHGPGITKRDALTLTRRDLGGARLGISNPPWKRIELHPLVAHLSDLMPIWLLIDSDWANTRQAGELIRYRLRKIVVVGRLRWIEGTTMSGKEDASWFLFDKADANNTTQFFGRIPNEEHR